MSGKHRYIRLAGLAALLVALSVPTSAVAGTYDRAQYEVDARKIAGPRSRYLDNLVSVLRTISANVPQQQDLIGAELTIKSNGAITDVAVNYAKDESIADRIKAKIAALRYSDRPPVDVSFPITLTAYLSSNPQFVTVSNKGWVDFPAYVAEIQKRVKQCWHPPKHFPLMRTVVTFVVWRDGKITDLKIDKSSHFIAMDQSVLDAVEHASPVQPIPDGGPMFLNIQLVMDYHSARSSL